MCLANVRVLSYVHEGRRRLHSAKECSRRSLASPLAGGQQRSSLGTQSAGLLLPSAEQTGEEGLLSVRHSELEGKEQ